MTESFEYIRNKYCHEVLSALYYHSSGIAKESTLKEMVEGKDGKLISNTFFPNLDLTGLDKKLNITDVLLQDVCEYLESNNHIEAATKTTKGIFEKIKFTKPGVTAYKSNFYLKENNKQSQLEELHKSTVSTNKWMRLLTLVLAIAAALTLIVQIKQCAVSQEQSTTQSHQQTKEQPSYNQNVKDTHSVVDDQSMKSGHNKGLSTDSLTKTK